MSIKNPIFMVHPFSVKDIHDDPTATVTLDIETAESAVQILNESVPLVKQFIAEVGEYADFGDFLKFNKPISTLKYLSDGPPRARAAFPIPPKPHWVYRVQKRIWLRFEDGREEWSEWMNVLTPYYLRKHAATKAMERYISSTRYSVVERKYEFQVAAVEHPTGVPFRKKLEAARRLRRKKR